MAGVPVIAVPPKWTTQDYSGVLPDGLPCPERVRKSLSVRTHRCPRCGLVLDRDHNAALNILTAALALNCTAGQAGTGSHLATNASGQLAAPAVSATGRSKRAG